MLAQVKRYGIIKIQYVTGRLHKTNSAWGKSVRGGY